MKLKYQLRGFAIGIIIAGIFISVVSGNEESTIHGETTQNEADGKLLHKDKEVVKDTIENTAEVDTDHIESTEEKSSDETESTEELDSEETGSNDVENTEEIPVEEEQNIEENVSEEVEQVLDSVTEEMVVVQIVGGDSSVSVSNKLFELGLIPDVNEYDQYLCQNGYDKAIRVGHHELPVDATYEEIAKAISSR